MRQRAVQFIRAQIRRTAGEVISNRRELSARIDRA